MGISFRSPYFTKRGRLYMEDNRGRLSNPTPNQKRQFAKGRKAKRGRR